MVTVYSGWWVDGEERGVENQWQAHPMQRKAGEPLVIEEVFVAPRQPHEVRIRIICTSLCHSDITFWKLKEPPAIYPRIFGHKALGYMSMYMLQVLMFRHSCDATLTLNDISITHKIVESVGENVDEVAEGDVVLPTFLPDCGECTDCSSMKSNLCTKFPFKVSPYMPRYLESRFTDLNGEALHHFLFVSSFSQYTVVDVACIVKIDPVIPPNRACLLSCGVSTGFDAAWRTANVEPGSTVVIFWVRCNWPGEGARACGASRIIRVDLNPDKLELGNGGDGTERVECQVPSITIEEDMHEERSTDGDANTINEESPAKTKASWSELPKELLSKIANLLDLIDLLSFRGVCNEWRKASSIASAEIQIHRRPIPLWSKISCIKSRLASHLQARFNFLPVPLLAKIDKPDFPSQEVDYHAAAFLAPPTSPDCMEGERALCSVFTAMEAKESSKTQGKPIRCKAAVCRQAGDPLVIEEVIVAPPRPREVRIRVICTSLCHSDITFWKLQVPPGICPRILGHEAIGIVESVGENVDEVAEGDVVLPTFLPDCGECTDCKSKKSNLCSQFPFQVSPCMLRYQESRFTDLNGEVLHHFLFVSSFSQYTVVDIANITKVDPAIPPNRACLLSCGVSTGVGAAWKKASVEPGSTVAIFGLGAIGLAVAEGARLCGATRIIGVDINPGKFELGKKFGVTDFVNSARCGDKSVSQVIKEMTDGGADYCFECVGMASLVDEAFACCRKGWGKTVVLGVDKPGSMLSLSSFEVLHSGKSLMGSLFGGLKAKTDIPVLLKRYMDKELQLDEFVTHEVKFEEINEAFNLLLEGKSLRCVIWMDK
ncbi:F-box domain [Dillenia turbinata]|uniref:F-box domain n=1 Tax=Dillenia turbinata TaxID=194707 RepID=A0AAN8ZIK7_9MAGN